MSTTMSTPSRTSLHLHLARRDLQRSPRGSVTRVRLRKPHVMEYPSCPLLLMRSNWYLFMVWRTMLFIQTGSWDIGLEILERRNADIIILYSSKDTSGSVKEYAS